MTRCIAYADSGQVCRAPAAVLDTERGGMVCTEHAPQSTAACKARALKRLTGIANYYMEAVAAGNATEAELSEMEREAEIAVRWCRAYGAVTGEIEAAYRAGLATAK